MSLEEDFERSRKDESYRQAFLDQIDLEDAARFVKRLIYNPTQKYGGDTTEKITVLMECQARPFNLLGLSIYFKFRKSHIYVYPASFNKDIIPSVNHFLSNLIDHEGFHAKQHYSLIDLDDPDKREFSAYWVQLMLSSRRGLDDKSRANIAYNCMRSQNF